MGGNSDTIAVGCMRSATVALSEEPSWSRAELAFEEQVQVTWQHCHASLFSPQPPESKLRCHQREERTEERARIEASRMDAVGLGLGCMMRHSPRLLLIGNKMVSNI